MIVKHSHIVEARELRDNRIILCYIQVANRTLEYYHGQSKPHWTNRWMQPEDWASFDAHLEIMLDSQNQKRIQDLREHTFQLNDLIKVRVRQSRFSIEVLKQCIWEAEKWKILQALEFYIEYKEQETPSSRLRRNTKHFVLGLQDNDDEDYEYEPAFVSSADSNGAGSQSNVNTYVPYTPSTKAVGCSSVIGKYTVENTEGKDYQHLLHEEPYSPKPVSDCSPDKSNDTPPLVPAYRPARKRNDTQDKQTSEIKTKDNKKMEMKANQDECRNNSEHEYKKSKSKKKKMKSDDNIKSSKTEEEKLKERERKRSNRDEVLEKDRDSRDENSVSKERLHSRRHKHEDGSTAEQKNEKEAQRKEETISALVSKDAKHEKRKPNLIKHNQDCDRLQLRRSSRSPAKPKRFDEEKFEKNRPNSSSPKRMNEKANKINEDLFGSDEDFVEARFTRKSPEIKRQTVTSSAKKKRKRELSSDRSKEKQSTDLWLEKNSTKKTITSIASTKKNVIYKKSPSAIKRSTSTDNSESPSQSPLLAATYQSKKEIEDQIVQEKIQMEENLKIKEALVKLAGPPPAKVETLNVEDLNLVEIMESFEQYRSKLDVIFRKSPKYSQARGYEGINHSLVMSLIDHKNQLSMMSKLRDEYEPDCEGVSAYANLYANAMMPEWVMCLFMDKHKLTREEAIKHVKAQEAYTLHLAAQMENSMHLE